MDIIICGGGQTLFEMCALGLPTLALANELHEEQTIDFISKRNSCINLGSVHHNINSGRILRRTIIAASFANEFKSAPTNPCVTFATSFSVTFFARGMFLV